MTTHANNTNGRQNTTLRTLTALALLLATQAGAQAQTNNNGDARRVLIKVRSDRNANRQSSLSSLATLKSARSLDKTTDTGWIVATIEDGKTLDEAIAEVAQQADVEAVEADQMMQAPERLFGNTMEPELSAASADPNANRQYGLSKIQAEDAWRIHGGSRSVIVAVVDTGVQLDHPDLTGHIWTNPYEVMNGVDDDDNGLVDDVYGWNFVSGTNDPSDDNDHGTHVAGIIAAVRDNNIGIAGAANVTIMPIKALGSDMSGAMSDVIAGIRYAIDNGADVINLSLGAEGGSQALSEVCEEAASKGVVIVAATGNASSGSIDYPAAFDSTIAVGATDSNDNVADFSNYGDGIDITAPGVNILSTVGGSNYANFSGTSMATPHVAAVAALLRSMDPNMTAAQIRSRMNNTTDDRGDAGYDAVYGSGRLNAYRALSNGNPVSDNGDHGADNATDANPDKNAADLLVVTQGCGAGGSQMLMAFGAGMIGAGTMARRRNRKNRR